MSQPTRFQVLTLLIFCELAPIPHASNVNETIRASLPLENCAYELETEYYGKHFRKLTVKNPGECCDACQKDPKCNVWTYKLPSASKNRKTCWLLKDATVVNRVESNPDKEVSAIHQLRTKSVNECAEFSAKKLIFKSVPFQKKRT